jgi:type IV pilus assembly protein PilM
MSFLSTSISDFFGLDIGATAIRLVQLMGNGSTKTLQRYAYVPIDSKLTLSDAKGDQQKVANTIKSLVEKSGVSTRNVAAGLASQRVFTTVVDIDRLSPGELDKSIQFQADSLIPTPLAESKIDWRVIGDSPTDKTKVEVLLSSVTNEYVERRLDLLESIGLNAVAFEPDSLALARSLVPPESAAPQMLLDIGSKATDLVIVKSGAPHLTRAIPTGMEAVIRAAIQNLNIDENQAQQFVSKFGLSQDKLEGQIYHAIVGTVDILMTEIEKSIKFFQTRYPNDKLDRIIVTGGASVLPELPLYLANKFGINVEIGNAWRNVSFPASRQNELLAISNQFSVAAGLAERSGQ